MINHVSDTSAWVAYYRSLETDKKNPIFKDPFAKILVGDRAKSFAKAHTKVNRWTEWTVVMRTYIIDQMIRDLIAGGVKTFVNVGAGLDSRPYRMELDSNIHWIEIDFPHVIEHKEKELKDYKPTCKLERISLDLSKREERQELFNKISNTHNKIAVLTEGVLPYLTETQVSELSEDLMSLSSFRYWICEYISPMSYKVLKDPKHMKSLRNSPFQFFPENWKGFFETRGWDLKEEKYYVDVSEKFNRPTPFPKIMKLIAFIKGNEWTKPFRRMSGYLMWQKKD